MKSLREAARSPMARYKLEYLLTDVVHGYFQRVVGDTSGQTQRDRNRTGVSAHRGHLLGLGFSPDKLHGWATWLQEGKHAKRP